VSAHPNLSKAISALPNLLVSRVSYVEEGQRCALCYRSRGEGGLRLITLQGAVVCTCRLMYVVRQMTDHMWQQIFCRHAHMYVQVDMCCE
jgi:uncharacterized UBP type Zn finger protein